MVMYGTRWVAGVNDGTTGATDAWQSATPVVETTGLSSTFASGRALHISVPANGSSTPGGTAGPPDSAYQRCEQYPNPVVTGISGGTWGPGFTGFFGLSILLDTDFPTNPLESGGGQAWQVITQFKNDGTGSPPIEVKIGGGKLRLDGNSGGWSTDICPVSAGQRYNILLGLTFTESASTSVANVWVNGTQYLTNFHPTGAGFLYTGVRSYWKAGIYRETGLPTQAKASLWFGALCFDTTQATAQSYLDATVTSAGPTTQTATATLAGAGLLTARVPTAQTAAAPLAGAGSLAANVAGTPLSALASDFTTMPPFFNANSGGVFIDGTGQGQAPTNPASTGYGVFGTGGTYSLAGSSVYVKVVQASGLSGTRQNSIKLNVDANNSVEMLLSGGTFKGRVQKAGVNTDATLATYSATTHAWWRIREASGTVFFDTSTDGTTWTNLASATHGLTVSAVQLRLQAGYFGAAGSETNPPNAIYDNLNTVSTAYAKTINDTAGAADGPVTTALTPGQVTGLTVGTITSSSVALSWTATPNATSYLVEYRVAP